MAGTFALTTLLLKSTVTLLVPATATVDEYVQCALAVTFVVGLLQVW